MIKEKFERAAAFHGHRCPGLAIGVRAAEEAVRLLGTAELYCMAESSACYIDGIQALCGCTVGNGRLKFHPTGKTAFSFYTAGGEGVRLLLKPAGGGMSREEHIDFLLTAPLEEVYAVGGPRVPWPDYVPSKRESAPCAVCGEPTALAELREKDGKRVCVDCAGIVDKTGKAC